ncbi:vitamin K epoxide reductase family protein [Cyanobium sp. T1B-Tous]|uniref:vitamin K epoxide reductase family protein n=1 Tax=Cyanobium sp. T1B-Tous TaxID=2823721 RepID=UPI0020CBA7B9|nr:vitamin K epoxide reductase family protein [Cyanobium sp. T1B-Tous]
MTSTRLSQRLSSSRRRSDPARRWARVAMAVLATVGFIDTGAITLKRWGLLGPLSCPGGAEGCDKVLNSAWGSLFGQPLSLFGWMAYAAVLVLAVLPLVLRGDSRAALAQRSWWGLLLLSTGMAVFSLLLMGLMVVKIQAFCFFCVLSASLSLGLFVLSLVGGEWDDRGQVLFRAVIVALVVAMLGLGWAASVDRPVAASGKGVPPAVVATSSPQAVALADHLTRSGAVMYTAYWCPHCHEQKELFGKAATAQLTLVECAADGRNSQKALCDSKKIEGFPTWEINGTLDSGVKSLDQLAQLSGYTGPLR